MLLQIFEGLRSIVEGVVRELWEGFGEVSGQVFVDPVAHSGVAHHVEETDMLVEVGSVEESAADLGSVRATLIMAEHHAVVAECRFERVGAERRA